MSVIVQKYGGSSVADVDKIARVADRVVATKLAGHEVVVVVSAMGKTTDSLLELARSVAIRSAAGSAGASDVAPPRRELDMLVSTGERVTMALLSIAIAARGHDAISFTGSQSGILTNDRHFDARIIEVRPHRISDELARGKIVIVAGYQGMSYKREITTLGRGGSDTTAVALAAALGAQVCEIYSDVDGVYSADPRVVPDAAHLPQIDLAMLAEMAESGAKVVNAQAVEWARRHRVVIHARRTSDEAGEGRETRAAESSFPLGLRDQTESRDGADCNRVPDAPAPSNGTEPFGRVRAVVGLPRVAVMRVSAARLGEVLERAASLDVSVSDVVALDDAALVHVPLLNTPDWERSRRIVASEFGDDAIDLGTFAMVSVVGYGLTEPHGGLVVMKQCLDRLDAKAVCLSAGPLRLRATIAQEVLEEAQRVLHRAFITA